MVSLLLGVANQPFPREITHLAGDAGRFVAQGRRVSGCMKAGGTSN
jgi:hypothetical protein